MKFGLHLDHAHTGNPNTITSNWLESVLIADAAGFDYVSVVDHLVPFPEFRPREVPLLDPWQLLSAFAVQTKSVTLLTLVSNGSIAHPSRLTKQAATLDLLSSGRMMLGLGAGGYEADEAALGIDGRSQSERYARLQECIDVVTELWTGKEVSVHGEYFNLGAYTSSPTPSDGPKILIAGKSKAILRLAANKASACNFAFPDTGALEALIKDLQPFLNEAGKNLSDFEVTLLDRVFIGPSDSKANEAWQAAGAPVVNGHPGLIGGVAKLVRDIEALQQHGADTLFCMFQDLSSLKRFSEDVLPQFR